MTCDKYQDRKCCIVYILVCDVQCFPDTRIYDSNLLPVTRRLITMSGNDAIVLFMLYTRTPEELTSEFHEKIP